MIKLPEGEKRKIRRFIIIVIGATVIHLGVAEVALPFIGRADIASFCGFIVAFCFAYPCHKFFTFSDATHSSVYKFFTVAFSSFLISLFLLSQLRVFSPPLALGISILVIPVINYFLSRFWVFKFQK